MEKIKVNMSPNPLDVQTIHASQNDGEARQWGFELHNNGELIDTSDVKEQLFFKAYKGGTEQILPENTSTPTTSPFKGDIKYPQGLLSDQEFLYRESPTEEDGLAKITDIKGNTIVWNQLIAKGNMTDGWTFSNSTGSYSNNVLTFTASAQGGFVRPNNPQSIVANHKYLAMVDVKATSAFTSTINFTSRNLISINTTTNWQTFSLVFTNTITEQNYFPRIYDYRQRGWDAISIRNCMLIDLTAMGMDITDPSDFTSLFSLPYYAYNQGSLLSFNGNGIKTTGKNQIDQSTFVQGSVSGTGVDTSTTTRLRSALTKVLPNTQYTLSGVNSGTRIYEVHYYDGSGVWITFQSINREQATFTTLSNAEYIKVLIRHTDNSNIEVAELTALQLEIGSTATSFEPYAESILSLPISTYFPTGMKSAGNVYDELTPRKAITRIGAVVLGSLTYTYDGECFIGQLPSDAKVLSTNNETLNSITPIYQINDWAAVKFNKTNMTLGTGVSRYICIFNTSYTDPTAFKTAMAGQYLYYELATPTETSFTTASLVTENAEITLSNEDGVLVGKCTEQLSAEPGFHDAKIKLSDGDGECYSNKIQLHVERSPQ